MCVCYFSGKWMKAIQFDWKAKVKYGGWAGYITINMNMIDNECLTCHVC